MGIEAPNYELTAEELAAQETIKAIKQATKDFQALRAGINVESLKGITNEVKIIDNVKYMVKKNGKEEEELHKQ